MTLYRAIDLPTEEPVQFVGVYVLKWSKVAEPTVGFVEVEGRAVAPMEENIRLQELLSDAADRAFTAVNPDEFRLLQDERDELRASLKARRACNDDLRSENTLLEKQLSFVTREKEHHGGVAMKYMRRYKALWAALKAAPNPTPDAQPLLGECYCVAGEYDDWYFGQRRAALGEGE